MKIRNLIFAMASLASFAASLEAATYVLIPSLPQTVIKSVNSGVVVSGYMNGKSPSYALAATDFNNNLVTIYSHNGAAWNSPSYSYYNSYTGPWISASPTSYMATFLGLSVGYTTATPFVVISHDKGSTWSYEEALSLSTDVATPVTICSVTTGGQRMQTGYMVTWLDKGMGAPWLAYTPDDGMSWYSQKIAMPGSAASIVGVAGTSAGFGASWRNFSNDAVASFSTDNGNNWSTTANITFSGDVGSDVMICGSDSGFMAVWVSSYGSAFCSYTSDLGANWSAPSPIATNVALGTDVMVCSFSNGFIAAWIGQDQNAYASLTQDQGANWSTPLSLVSNHTVATSYPDSSLGFVSVSAVANTCVFAWLDTYQNAKACFVSIVDPPDKALKPVGILPPTNLKGSQKKNDFALLYEVYNHLTWTASASATVTGYNIYKNGNLIASVGPFQLYYDDHNQQKGVTNNYGVSSFDAKGDQSVRVHIQIP